MRRASSSRRLIFAATWLALAGFAGKASAQISPSSAAAADSVSPETLTNLKIMSALLARGSRPMTLVRPDGFTLGLDLSLIQLPPVVTNGLADVAKKFVVVPFPDIAVEKSNGRMLDGISVFYFTVSPVAGAVATFEMLRFTHDFFINADQTWVAGFNGGYSGVTLTRTVNLSGQEVNESLRYNGYDALATLGYEPGGRSVGLATKGGKAPGVTLMPYVGVGAWKYSTRLDVDFSNLHLKDAETTPYGDAGVSLCFGHGGFCSTLDLTDDHISGAVIMFGLHGRR